MHILKCKKTFWSHFIIKMGFSFFPFFFFFFFFWRSDLTLLFFLMKKNGGKIVAIRIYIYIVVKHGLRNAMLSRDCSVFVVLKYDERFT